MDELTQILDKIRLTPQAELASLAVVAIDNGQTAYEYFGGYRYIDSNNPTHNLRVNRDTKYRVASISKAIVAVAVMQLVERDLLNLDADVSHYLGFPLRNPNYPNDKITTRHLLSHTSSIRDGSTYSISLSHTMRDFFLQDGEFYNNGEHFASPTETIEPRIGQYFAYCNLNYGVLGTIIEAASGQRFDQYMQAHIFVPLSIDASYNVNRLSEDGFENLAVLYRKFNGDIWQPNEDWIAQCDDYRNIRPLSGLSIQNANSNTLQMLEQYTIGTNGTLFSPQGGLRISATDLVRLIQIWTHQGYVRNHQLLQADTVKLMQSIQWQYNNSQANGDTYNGLMRSWGLGLQHTTATTTTSNQGDAIGAPHAGKMWGHAGDAYGLLSGMWFNAETGKGFVYIIGGVGNNLSEHTGHFSSFYRWEEEIMQAVVKYALT